jgi:hypothetical protein
MKNVNIVYKFSEINLDEEYDRVVGIYVLKIKTPHKEWE